MRPLLHLLTLVGKDARREVESVLEAAFRAPDGVSRLTAEVLNSVR